MKNKYGKFTWSATSKLRLHEGQGYASCERTITIPSDFYKEGVLA